MTLARVDTSSSEKAGAFTVEWRPKGPKLCGRGSYFWHRRVGFFCLLVGIGAAVDVQRHIVAAFRAPRRLCSPGRDAIWVVGMPTTQHFHFHALLQIR